ncbi:hypothetical protein CEXT_673571 [Caerostris extrusa]|uniref:Uncharacterized protein n=1 Tax=Caerostris extrusa TaxID=172846 RepID=A0AAV4QE13_CAEEX|nr:hypothetical protein CEXT_673571 [Caerostris extrusa]
MNTKRTGNIKEKSVADKVDSGKSKRFKRKSVSEPKKCWRNPEIKDSNRRKANSSPQSLAGHVNRQDNRSENESLIADNFCREFVINVNCIFDILPIPFAPPPSIGSLNIDRCSRVSNGPVHSASKQFTI